MSTDPTNQPAPLPSPTIHEATCVPGGVRRGAVISEAEAVARRQGGLDIVVCGDDSVENRDVAEQIEQQVGGPYFHDGPHRMRIGPGALPHWQQRPIPSGSPAGHSFYETHATKALR